MIVQYKKEWDDCGTVRDIIESADPATSFIFECVDDKNPGSVVVGTWKMPKISGLSLQARDVDLKHLRFLPIRDRLRFVPHRSGSDDGRDLVDLARQRAAKKKASTGK